MKRAALRYAEILEKGAWVTHQEQDEIAKLLRSLVMNDDAEDRAWDELEARLNRQKAIKQPEQEPVAWMYPSDLKAFETDEATATAFSIKVGCPDEVSVPLYTSPPSKPWVSLTGDEIDDIAAESGFGYVNVARAIEAKLKEKNNG